MGEWVFMLFVKGIEVSCCLVLGAVVFGLEVDCVGIGMGMDAGMVRTGGSDRNIERYVESMGCHAVVATRDTIPKPEKKKGLCYGWPLWSSVQIYLHLS